LKSWINVNLECTCSVKYQVIKKKNRSENEDVCNWS